MPDRELVLPSHTSAQLEQIQAGGLVEAALSGPERSMDTLVQGHLAQVALLGGKGDTTPERPFYIFNPDTGLLINYALRRDEDPAKSGLFADVVELDKDGKPRHGVSVINPFATSTGFINVAVGDNPYGFAPSYTELRMDSDDPLQTVPPNLETADLLAMLGQDMIGQDESLADFVSRRQQARAEFRTKVQQQKKRSYLGTVQAFDEHSNPDMHLIVSDRDDPSALLAASREVGLYPLLITGDELLDHYKRYKRMVDAPEHLGESMSDLIRHKYPELFDWLGGNAVSFVTLDIPQDKQHALDDRGVFMPVQTELPRRMTRDDESGKKEIVWDSVPRSAKIDEFAKTIFGRSHIFARVYNTMLGGGYSVEKVGHGRYDQEPYGDDGSNLQEYTDLLRKLRLDMALTLYLRGLNQL